MPERARYWSWRIENGPPLSLALPVGYALRAAVLEAAAGRGLDRMPEALHSSEPDGGHRHAYWLPEDRDRDGTIDHVALFAETGIEPAFANALCATRTLRLGEQPFALTPAEAGAGRKGGVFGPARVWIAATPFVTRLWRRTRTGKARADFTPTAQVVREIGEAEDRDGNRRLPEPVAVAWLAAIAAGNRLAMPRDFVLTTDRARPVGDAVAGFPVITFAQAVAGPIALGYGAHFGLGLLVPADAEPGG